MGSGKSGQYKKTQGAQEPDISRMYAENAYGTGGTATDGSYYSDASRYEDTSSYYTVTNDDGTESIYKIYKPGEEPPAEYEAAFNIYKDVTAENPEFANDSFYIGKDGLPHLIGNKKDTFMDKLIDAMTGLAAKFGRNMGEYWDRNSDYVKGQISDYRKSHPKDKSSDYEIWIKLGKPTPPPPFGVSGIRD